MATTAEIPAKYVPALCRYACAILLEQQERKAEAMDMYRQADQRLCNIYCADDMQENYRRIERVGI